MTAAAGLQGHLDRADRVVIEGWAFDPAQPAQPVVLALFDNGAPVLRVSAGQYRTDLEGVGRGGYCAFRIGLPAGLSPGPHRLSLRDLAGRELPNSPRDLPALAEVTQLLTGLTEGDAARRAALLRPLLGAATTLLARRDPAAAAALEARWHQPLPVATAPAGPRCLVLAETGAAPGRPAALQRLGHAVLVATADLDRPAGLPEAVTVCAGPLYASVEEVLRRQAGLVELLLFGGVGMALQYAALARRLLPRARLVLDLPRLDSVALARQAAVEADGSLAGQARQRRAAEEIAAWLVPRVMLPCPAEAALLRGIAPQAVVHVVPPDDDAALRRATA